ncbi:LysR family transcriptional regulator [Microbacterium sp. ZW T5_56]|uniref:LysR family transcriptional regulator n=1 Tax=Microbacterium sp. ZW T5_56 TaxID=3378081 RepID=UPI0038522BEC
MASPDLEHLRTFVTVHRTGSLTEAAALLGLSQPTVTARIKELEAACGHPLFDRTRTGVTATARGDELARAAAASVDLLDDLLTSHLSAPATAIQLGGPAELLSVMVVPRLADIVAVIGAPVQLTFGVADSLLDMLRAGALDIVVSAVRPHARGISAAPLYDEEFVLVGAPRWRDHSPRTEFDPWAEIPVVAYAQNLPIIRRYWQSVFARRPDGLTVTAVIPDLRGVRDAVLAGAGMSVLPEYLVRDHLVRGELVLLDTPEVAPLNTVYVATRSGETARNQRVRDIENELRTIIR